MLSLRSEQIEGTERPGTGQKTSAFIEQPTVSNVSGEQSAGKHYVSGGNKKQEEVAEKPEVGTQRIENHRVETRQTASKK